MNANKQFVQLVLMAFTLFSLATACEVTPEQKVQEPEPDWLPPEGQWMIFHTYLKDGASLTEDPDDCSAIAIPVVDGVPMTVFCDKEDPIRRAFRITPGTHTITLVPANFVGEPKVITVGDERVSEEYFSIYRGTP